MRRRILLIFLALAALGAAGALAQTEITATSRPLRLLHRWQETVKGTSGEYPRRVDVIFDYRKGAAYEVFWSLDGKRIGRMTLGPGQPAPSEAEIQEAYDLVRSDPEFEPIFRRFQPVFEGGFVLLERRGQPCGPGSRCLRVFLLSSDRSGTIRQAIVDLVKQSVIYPDFVPERWIAR